MQAVNMDKYQETALDLYLLQWPRDWEFYEVLEAVRNEIDEYITVWQPLAHWRGDLIADEIESAVTILRMRFEPRKTPA